MKNKIDLAGSKFSRLTVISFCGKDRFGNKLWNCQCDCGNEIIVRNDRLFNGHNKSCGKCHPKNRFYIFCNFCIGITANGSYFSFDIDEFDKISKHSWHNNGRYFQSYINRRKILLHRFILSDSKQCIDHIDGNPANNCKNNLRICSHAENLRNRWKGRGNTSKYKGVSYIAKNKKWYACIGVNYKTINLGTYDNENDAARAYNEAALRYHGEFAKLNVFEAANF